MKELQISKMGTGHQVSMDRVLVLAAPHNLLGLRFLLRVLEQTVPAQRLGREPNGLTHDT